MRPLALALLIFLSPVAFATGLASCDSGDVSSWQSKDALKTKLTDAGWEVRLIKEDGGCYEVYAIDAKKARVEAYFHPVSLERVEIKAEH